MGLYVNRQLASFIKCTAQNSQGAAAGSGEGCVLCSHLEAIIHLLTMGKLAEGFLKFCIFYPYFISRFSSQELGGDLLHKAEDLSSDPRPL